MGNCQGALVVGAVGEQHWQPVDVVPGIHNSVAAPREPNTSSVLMWWKRKRSRLWLGPAAATALRAEQIFELLVAEHEHRFSVERRLGGFVAHAPGLIHSLNMGWAEAVA